MVRKVAVLLEPLACSSAELGCGSPWGPSRGDRQARWRAAAAAAAAEQTLGRGWAGRGCS